MAIYRQLGLPSASRERWSEVDFIAVVRVEAGRVVILNSDGTETHLLSESGDFVLGPGGVTGTVSGARRTDDASAIAFESIDGLSASVPAMLAGGGNLFAVVADTAAQIFWQEPLVFAPIAASDIFDLSVTDVAPSTSVIDFSMASASVTFALSEPAAASVAGQGEDTVPVEKVIGSDFEDEIAGNAADNVLVGGAGADQLVGGAGDDTLVGGLGDDTLWLGEGGDVIEFHAGDGWDTVFDFGVAGVDMIALSGFANFASFNDLIASNALVAADGVVELRLGSGDGLLLAGITRLDALTAANFKF